MNVPAPKKRRRYLKIAAGALTVGVLALAFALRSPSPVGHWNSAAGEDRFLAAYDRAFEDLPDPAETLDIRTDYGVVRVYRFEGTGTSTHPLLLLPGRSSATPVWAANLPGLLTIGDVYTVDLLGEPGRSIQERPITSDEDQATWLDQTLAALPTDKVHLVGLSIGGWTAANLALHDSTHLATLTLIDPAQTFADIPWGTAIRALPAAVPWLPKSWRDSFNSYTAGGAEVQDVPVADMIEAGMQGYSLKLPQPTRFAEDRLATLDVPVLAIIAGRSVMHDAQEAVATAERTLPDGTVRLYPDASHAVNGEYPERVRDDIADFVLQYR
ncbi:alpha/beta hydrolase [Rhodococcus sp. 06-462-5]|uniref:alpha/beta fold hydrolase n=1 Tax=unclassified Rhodococcus (in: high G+C Gram-positive bacteria) TaxID=192944 RepID=UPI000B9AE5AD|nr:MULTISPECIES: alpha/beta hydrolase [unclassified Rhodococcus (in: high G+C Gram-positive bacteria)]OZC72336.1 alpha/beta hydrolase [Rhodococcus sp. 06-462-5]OZE65671.1 alpha/beta hydrolase [Rhodococcus sp. 02-925g]